MTRALVRLAAVCSGLLLVAGCSSRRGLPINASAYRTVVARAIFAFAWGGAAGFEGEDAYDVRVVFAPDPDARDYRLLMCSAPAGHCDSLAHFTDLDLEPRPFAGGLLAEYRTKISEVDSQLMVTAVRGGELLVSDAIVATRATRPTAYGTGGLIFDATNQRFSWPRIPDEALYLLLVLDDKDERGLAGISTQRKSWTYPELQGIVQYFHDPETVRDLDPARKKSALLFAINPRGWATRMTDVALP